ncbi:MAG: flagellar biosynthetic protein FliO, partial [Armatimonadetes bacterium]|nr:flagellar biosynthetic protein FliO [Armatimonadota bacterium]
WVKTGLVTLLKLGLVLALAYVTIRALKWLSDKREAAPHSSQTMQLLETMKLSTGGNLHLVNVRGRTLLVGCTAGQVNLLSEVGESESPQPDQAASHRFAEYLEKYYTNPKSAGPATRIAGLLRDCTAHLRRSRHRADAGRVEAGEINES